VVVLPILIEQVELPGFLKGKKYADFSDATHYQDALAQVLNRLGPAAPPPASETELARLRAELEIAQAAADAYSRDLKRHRKVVARRRSPSLQREIERENKEVPAYAAVNNSYAFEIDGFPVTLGYVMWSLRKAAIKGGPSPLELMIELNDRWDDVKLMLEAYGDYLGRKPKSAKRHKKRGA
jgi:hypothetical protein